MYLEKYLQGYCCNLGFVRFVAAFLVIYAHSFPLSVGYARLDLLMRTTGGAMSFGSFCFLQALFPQKCRLNSSKLHGEFPQYCISSAGTLSGAGEEPLQAYKVY